MEEKSNTKRKSLIRFLVILTWLLPLDARSATIDEVTFINKVESYEAIVDTSLITQEGKRFPIPRGTRLNVAGFTTTEAFVISRMDKPNGFVRKADISPAGGRSGIREETIREEPIQ
jgi:hypothetical protein